MSEEMIIRHCSPTLAGLKTGSLFTCPYETKEALMKEIRRLNLLLSGKGLRILPLRYSGKKALIYIYRPALLKEDLLHGAAAALLSDHGYPRESPDHCVVRLVSRLQENSEFPHEIGLFLGYPPEDVLGFIENNARHAKCIGDWKVYGDAEKAQALFSAYQQCTNHYIHLLTAGSSIEHLAVAV